MGYWATSLTGMSLQLIGDLNPDGSEMLWGDAPADAIDGGISKLIGRLRADLGRFPTVDEVNAIKATAPEMIEAIAAARKVFTEDIEREPTDGEIAAGLAFCDTEISLDYEQRKNIVVGDTIRWPILRQRNFFQEIDYVAEAAVEAIEERETVNKWTGLIRPKAVYVVTHDGDKVDVDICDANKVLPGDEPVEVENARREERRAQEEDSFLPDEGDDTGEDDGGFGLIFNR